MGLLDDAIREHLELKRRRGADTAEVARQEQEAFGPPRRGDFEVAPAAEAAEVEAAPTTLHVVDDLPHLDEGDHIHTADEPPEVQHEPPRPHGDPADQLPHMAPREPDLGQPTQAFDAEEVRAAITPPPREPEPEPEPVAAATPPPVVAEPEPVPEPEPEPEPEPAAPAPRAEEEEPEDEDADVLEETPEFLQETPEHDRLWFEQRPPRDFDF